MKAEFADHYKELATFKATEDSRRLTLPPNADAYELKLSKGFQAPQGVEFKVDPNDPMALAARNLAHKVGMSQADFEALVDIYAGGQIANHQTIKSARDAEITKLGAAGPARVDAVQNFYKAQLGEELGTIMSGTLLTARHVEAAEQLMASFRNQGAGTFSQAHRQPNEPARATPEQYNKMTYSERIQYAAQFPQPGGRPN